MSFRNINAYNWTDVSNRNLNPSPTVCLSKVYPYIYFPPRWSVFSSPQQCLSAWTLPSHHPYWFCSSWGWPSFCWMTCDQLRYLFGRQLNFYSRNRQLLGFRFYLNRKKKLQVMMKLKKYNHLNDQFWELRSLIVEVNAALNFEF